MIACIRRSQQESASSKCLRRQRHVGGDLWPVEPRMMPALPRPLATNERIVLEVRLSIAAVERSVLGKGLLCLLSRGWLPSTGVVPLKALLNEGLGCRWRSTF